MQYYRCRCGKCEAWGSDPPALCSGCPDCGSDLSGSPNTHREPKAHEFSSVESLVTDQGNATITRCCYCHKTRREIEKAVRPPDEFSVTEDGRTYVFKFDGDKGGWMRDDGNIRIRQECETFTVGISGQTDGWDFAGEGFRTYRAAATHGHRELHDAR